MIRALGAVKFVSTGPTDHRDQFDWTSRTRIAEISGFLSVGSL
ncbi:MAG: hypothetical protein OJF51_004437 [Nitrospira sp.]|nr:MAG: hypothetical protein OJF51_004437 [Nitrospira sp.]